jgi:hypothetical protein
MTENPVHSELKKLFFQVGSFALQFIQSQIVKFILHCLLQFLPCDKFGFDRQFRSGKPHGFHCQFFVDAADFKKNASWLNDGDPIFGISLSFTHAGFGGFFRIGHIRENSDPDFSAPLDMSRQSDTGRFDLAVRDPFIFEGYEAEVAERNFVSPGRVAFEGPSHPFSVFSSLWAQHALTPL